MFAKEFDILYQVLVFLITINTIVAFITIFRRPQNKYNKNPKPGINTNVIIQAKILAIERGRRN